MTSSPAAGRPDAPAGAAILGISALYHDAAACLARDGHLALGWLRLRLGMPPAVPAALRDRVGAVEIDGLVRQPAPPGGAAGGRGMMAVAEPHR